MVTAQGVHPDSFEYRWVAAVIRATEQRAGVASRWNGQVFIEPEHAGSAQEDGSFGVSQEILDLAGRAYRGEQLDDDELDTLRAGVATTVHEAKHLTSWPGDLSAPDAAQLHAPDVVSLEEGLAEEFAQQNTDDVIRDIGMDQVVPGLAGREQDDSSPAYTNATEQLVNGLAELGKADRICGSSCRTSRRCASAPRRPPRPRPANVIRCVHAVVSGWRTERDHVRGRGAGAAAAGFRAVRRRSCDDPDRE